MQPKRGKLELLLDQRPCSGRFVGLKRTLNLGLGLGDRSPLQARHNGASATHPSGCVARIPRQLCRAGDEGRPKLHPAAAGGPDMEGSRPPARAWHWARRSHQYRGNQHGEADLPFQRSPPKQKTDKASQAGRTSIRIADQWARLLRLQIEFVIAFIGVTLARAVAAPLNSAYRPVRACCGL